MPTDATKVIEAAASHGWEATTIAFLMVIGVGTAAYVIRTMVMNDKTRWTESIEREKRLAERVTKLEDNQQTLMAGLVEKTATALSENADTNRDLKIAIDSWRKHIEESGDRVRGCLDQFGSDCEKRWEEKLPEALRKHLPAVLERIEREKT